MKNANIKINDTTKLQHFIDEAQKRTKQRNIKISDIQEMSEKILKHCLKFFSYKKDFYGMEFQCDPNAQHYPNSYSYTPDSTQFTLTYTRNGWRVSNIERKPQDKYNARDFWVSNLGFELNEDIPQQLQSMLTKFMRNF